MNITPEDGGVKRTKNKHHILNFPGKSIDYFLYLYFLKKLRKIEVLLEEKNLVIKKNKKEFGLLVKRYADDKKSSEKLSTK